MEDFDIPANILEAADSARLDLLPEKSKICYEKEYRLFCEWRVREQIQGAWETVLLAYFVKLSNEYSPSSLWPKYSMLRACLELKERVEIDKYGALIRFIKKKNVGHRVKKSKVLTREQVKEFVCTAPDKEFLMMKVAFLIGLGGACRTNELVKMSTDDVEMLESKIVVTIPDSKTHKKRFFAVLSEGDINPVALFKKYIALRPRHVTHKRLFISYRNGKCTIQPCGINFFSKIPKKIASYLKLENPAMYTGHCIRRSSATLLVNAGGDILQLQELGGWESSKVAKEYLEENLTKKVSIAKKIQVGNDSISSGSKTTESMEFARTSKTLEDVRGLDLMYAESSHPNDASKAAEDLTMMMDTKCVSFNFNNCEKIEVHVHK